jgi:hypothetical protein
MGTSTMTAAWTTTIFSERLSYGNDKVRVCGMEDYKPCARSLAEAFYDDDVAFYFLDVPDNGGKTREQLWPLHLEILEYIVCAHIHNGLVLSIGDNHEGVALWYVGQHECKQNNGFVADPLQDATRKEHGRLVYNLQNWNVALVV